MERGRLRVYLGAAPGVGKTFAMLDEGRRRLRRGTDVVVGYVETHGRPKTLEAVEGLEVIGRRTLAYQGTTLAEMDLPAILARRPAVVLVDELAHTNVPGSEHEKRWQDVEALLDAGIHVITTVNIQHLESLNDITAGITRVRQRETVPDRVVRAADQLELVDMSPQSLRRRMAHGNIYAAEKVDAALSNYFREGNLAALRELALLWLADRVDEGLDRYRTQHDIDSTWAARERVVVAVSGGPESVTLMRRAAGIAARRSGAEWRTLYVTRSDGLSGVGPDRLAALRTKTEELGGTFHTAVGDDAGEAILAFARAENATQVIVGASRRSRLSTLLRPGIGEQVINDSGDIDVHIVTHDYARKATSGLRAPAGSLASGRRRTGYVFSVVAPLLASLLLRATSDLHGLPTEAMSLMVVVVGTALIGGLAPAMIAALFSGGLLNYLFTEPRYTLRIASAENAIAVVLFVVVAIAVATVVDNAARRTSEARRARAEADALTVLSHSLLNSGADLEGLLASATDMFHARGAVLLRGGAALASHGRAPASAASADVTAVIDDDTVLALSGPDLPAASRGLLKAYAAYAKALADRHTAQLAEADRLRLAEADRTRTALLAAVSHDLRTPLAGLKTAVTTLLDHQLSLPVEDRDALLEDIGTSTDRLTALVVNLLDMSRINTGSVGAITTEVALAPAVADALVSIEGGERVVVDVDDHVVVIADAGLLDRVLANIVENALKYTDSASAIRIDTVSGGGRVVLRIADRGPGVADQDRERMFTPFQRLGDVAERNGVITGVGLGLAVARGLTEAMGGTIDTEDTPGGGLSFLLEFPQAPDLDEAPAHP